MNDFYNHCNNERSAQTCYWRKLVHSCFSKNTFSLLFFLSFLSFNPDLFAKDASNYSSEFTCNETLVTYRGNCDDPSDGFYASEQSACINIASPLLPTGGRQFASCIDGIICIQSEFTDWDFSLTAGTDYIFSGISADFLFPVVQGTAGGPSNGADCFGIDYSVQFFLNGNLVETKSGAIGNDEITTADLFLSKPLEVSTGDVIKMVIKGNPSSSACQLFELAGLSVKGCCTAPPPPSCSETLVSYTGDCNDPEDSFHPSNQSDAIGLATPLRPTAGPNPYASCNDGIICIQSDSTDWDFTLTAANAYTFNGISADFLFPVELETAGGPANRIGKCFGFNYSVEFYLNGTLVETKAGAIDNDVITTKDIYLTTALEIAQGDKVQVVIKGNPTTTGCQLFELAGLSVKGCYTPPPPPTCNETLVTYRGNCDDPSDGFYASSQSACINIASPLLPTGGRQFASCIDNIICMQSQFTDWDFSLTAGTDYTFSGISADFLFPVVQGTAGGPSNGADCFGIDYSVQFFLNENLVETISGAIGNDVITTADIFLSTALEVSTGDVIKMVIKGNPSSSACQLFELAGLSVKGCCIAPPPGCGETLVTYSGDCNDPEDSFHASNQSSCISIATPVRPTAGPNPYASCNDGIICIQSDSTDWDFTLTAANAYTFSGISADFLFPVELETAGGPANRIGKCFGFNYSVEFHLNGSLVETKAGAIDNDVITTKDIFLTTPLQVAEGDEVKVVIKGNPTTSGCQLFELAGLSVKGCCSDICQEEFDGGQIVAGTCDNGTIIIENAGLPSIPTDVQSEIVWIKSEGQFSACERLGELGTVNINVGAAWDDFVAAGGFAAGIDPSIPNAPSWMFVTDNDGDDLQLTVNDSPKACYLRCTRIIGCGEFVGEAGPIETPDCLATCSDTDNDGTCDVDDCAPNDANFPGVPGASCDDGDNQTTNDVFSDDGCTCAGETTTTSTPSTGCEVLETCGAVTIKQSGTSIIIENLDGQDIVTVFNSSWSPVFTCAWWGPACEGTTTIDGLNVGETYRVKVKDCLFNILISGEDCNNGTDPVDPIDPDPVDPVDPVGPTDPVGQGCEILETCGAVTIKQSGTSIIIENLDGQDIVTAFNSKWSQIFNCAWWGTACEGTTTIEGLNVGETYVVKVKDCLFYIPISGEDCDNGSVPIDPVDPVDPVDSGMTVCDVDITQNGTSLTFTNVNKNSSVMVLDLSTWKAPFSCSPWGEACTGTFVVDGLTAGGEYMIKVANYASGCTEDITITVASSLNKVAQGRTINTTTLNNLAKDNGTLQQATTNKQVENDITPVASNSIPKKAELSVYPNPAFDVINVTMGNYEGQSGQINLFNGVGQHVTQLSIDQIDTAPVQVSLDQATSGLYYLQIIVDGQLVEMQKIIVEKR